MALKHDTLPSLNHISHSLSRATIPALPTPTTSCPHPYPTPSPPCNPEPQRLQAVLLGEGTVTDSCGARTRLCHMTHMFELWAAEDREPGRDTLLSLSLRLPTIQRTIWNTVFPICVRKCVFSSVVCLKASTWRDAGLFAVLLLKVWNKELVLCVYCVIVCMRYIVFLFII